MNEVASKFPVIFSIVKKSSKKGEKSSEYLMSQSQNSKMDDGLNSCLSYMDDLKNYNYCIGRTEAATGGVL